MNILLLVTVALVSVKATPTNTSCSVDNVKNCENYDLISTPRFLGFVTSNELEDICSRIQGALHCVGEAMKGCSVHETLLFDTTKGVTDIICGSRRQDYLKSVACFTKPEVKEAVVTKCMSSIPSSKTLKNPCSNLLQAPSCSYDVVFEVKSCSEYDSALMKDLVKAFLKPTVDAFTCPALVDKSTLASSITQKPDNDITEREQPKNTSSAEVKGDLMKVVQTDSQLSYILSALQPRVQIAGLPVCKDAAIVQVNNFIFLNSFFQTPNNSSRNNK